MFEIDPFIKVIDRIIQLLKKREDDRKNLFKEIIDPLFKEFELLAIDYISLFEKAEENIYKGNMNSLNHEISLIKKERDKIKMARIKIEELARALKNNKRDKEIIIFSDKVSKFFYILNSNKIDVDKNNKPIINCSFSEDLIRKIESYNIISDDFNHKELLKYINETKDQLKRRHISVAQSYSHLKLHCLV